MLTLGLPPFYRVSKTTTKHLQLHKRQTVLNLLNFTNIFPHLLHFYVIGIDIKCIAVQYFKQSKIYNYLWQLIN